MAISKERRSGEISAGRFTSGPQAGKALRWLEDHIVQERSGGPVLKHSSGMVLSYDAPRESPLWGMSSLYDNALAAIALTMTGRYELAEQLMKTVLSNMKDDGSLPFSFNLYASGREMKPSGDAVVRSGALAWFGYALVYYLENRSAGDGRKMADSIKGSLLDGAEKIAGKLLKYQVLNTDDPRHGLITGGDNTLVLRYNAAENKIEEVFVDGKIDWVSTEHNIDAYFFLKGLARLTGAERYRASASLIDNALRGRLWNPSAGQFNQGTSRQGVDSALSLDCAAWGMLFLWAAGDKERALRCIDAIERFRVTGNGKRGYRPFSDGAVFENRDLGIAVFGHYRQWKDVPLVWPEGSLGAAAAMARAGRGNDFRRIIRDILSLQGQDGGIPYATLEIPHLFSSYNATASSAWLIIALNVADRTAPGRKFWK